MIFLTKIILVLLGVFGVVFNLRSKIKNFKTSTITTQNFKPQHSSMFSKVLGHHPMILKSHSEANLQSFDADFAESISKPLPEWFLEQEALRQKQIQEMEEKSRKMLEEFRAKYIISEIEKAQMIARAREEKKKVKDEKEKSTKNWLSGVFGSAQEATAEITESEVENDDELTTREKWEIFLHEEKEDTGFHLPGFFDVFPELKFRWPIWAKKNGKIFKCETDSDCQFPQTCCAHPILPGEKFCCTGWGRRVMVPAYQPRSVQSSEKS